MSLLLRGIVQPRCARALRRRAGEIVDRTAAGRTHPRDVDIVGKRCIALIPDAHAALDLALRIADPVMRRRGAATPRPRRPRDVFAGALARSCAPSCANAPVPTSSRSSREQRRRSAPLATRARVQRPPLPDDHRSAGSPGTTCRVTTPGSRPEPHRPEEPVARRSARRGRRSLSQQHPATRTTLSEILPSGLSEIPPSGSRSQPGSSRHPTDVCACSGEPLNSRMRPCVPFPSNGR